MTILVVVLAVFNFVLAALYGGGACAEALRIRPMDTMSVCIGLFFSLISLATGVALVVFACAAP